MKRKRGEGIIESALKFLRRVTLSGLEFEDQITGGEGAHDICHELGPLVGSRTDVSSRVFFSNRGHDLLMVGDPLLLLHVGEVGIFAREFVRHFVGGTRWGRREDSRGKESCEENERNETRQDSKSSRAKERRMRREEKVKEWRGKGSRCRGRGRSGAGR